MAGFAAALLAIIATFGGVTSVPAEPPTPELALQSTVLADAVSAVEVAEALGARLNVSAPPTPSQAVLAATESKGLGYWECPIGTQVDPRGRQVVTGWFGYGGPWASWIDESGCVELTSR